MKIEIEISLIEESNKMLKYYIKISSYFLMNINWFVFIYIIRLDYYHKGDEYMEGKLWVW